MSFLQRLLAPAPPNVRELKAKRNVKGLVKALRYRRDAKVRRSAARALGEIRDPRAVKPLIAALKASSFLSSEAATALGKIADGRAVEPLIAALRDRKSPTRRAAAEALGEIGDARAVEPLIAALKDEGLVPSEAAGALGKIGDGRAVEPLIAALRDRESPARQGAAGALGEIGDARAVEPLIAALRDEKFKARDDAAGALGEIGDARAVEPLIAALIDDEIYVYQAVLKALVQIGDPHTVERLITNLKDANVRTRTRPGNVLEQIGEPAVAPLIEALRDKDRAVREIAAKTLIWIGDGRAVDQIIQYLKGEGDASLWEVASVFWALDKRQELRKRQDEFDPVYRELARRLDLPEERGGGEKAICHSGVVDEVIAKLREVAPSWPAILTESQVAASHQRTMWWESPLHSGTLSELLDVLESRLIEDSERPDFGFFYLSISYWHDGALRVRSYLGEDGFYRDCFVWRTDKKLFFCGFSL